MTGLEQLESHHGVLININGQGVFIRGQSNIGKSSLALELLYQGHQLISDDIAEFKVTPKGIIGYCPPLTSGLLHTKELGLIPVLDLFGKTAWRSEAILSCVTLEHYTICQTPFPMLRLCTKNPASLSHRIQTWLTLQLHNSNVTSTFMKKHQKALI